MCQIAVLGLRFVLSHLLLCKMNPLQDEYTRIPYVLRTVGHPNRDG